MHRINTEEGEVYILDKEEYKPAHRRRRFKTAGLTGRQRFEKSVQKVVSGLWDYVTGEGDDIDRARKMFLEDED